MHDTRLSAHATRRIFSGLPNRKTNMNATTRPLLRLQQYPDTHSTCRRLDPSKTGSGATNNGHFFRPELHTYVGCIRTQASTVQLTALLEECQAPPTRITTAGGTEQCKKGKCKMYRFHLRPLSLERPPKQTAISFPTDLDQGHTRAVFMPTVSHRCHTRTTSSHLACSACCQSLSGCVLRKRKIGGCADYISRVRTRL